MKGPDDEIFALNLELASANELAAGYAELLKMQAEETAQLRKMCRVLCYRCKAVGDAIGASCRWCVFRAECEEMLTAEDVSE